jgi:hypothetical protein
MSDNLRQYRAIRDALIQGYPGESTGRLARHLATLAAFISGIVASKSTQLPKVASNVPDSTKPESRVKRCARWMDNDTIRQCARASCTRYNLVGVATTLAIRAYTAKYLLSSICRLRLAPHQGVPTRRRL